MSHDGQDNGADVQLFVNFIFSGGASWRNVCSGDVESPSDGSINPDDVAGFLACLLEMP